MATERKSVTGAEVVERLRATAQQRWEVAEAYAKRAATLREQATDLRRVASRIAKQVQPEG